ncbi:MAG: hypothetical protein J0M34_04280 [Alphaproteobacteria bacterium]|nr:hypothetical protein [Alphaproteobacteria bacterium]
MADSIEILEIKGVGTYGVSTSFSWDGLYALVRTPENKLGFTPARHALFDGVIAQLFPTLGAHDLAGALNTTLRDNIACVRNYLMMRYFDDAPEGMNPDKVRESLRMIARFLGEGLQWDEQLRAGKERDPYKTAVSIEESSAPNGEGARYIYRKIQEMDRHSNWVRPFTKVMELVGGKGKSELALLPLDETPFAFDDHSDEERLREKLEEAAQDLDVLGDQLIHGAARAGGVNSLAEPVRREAIDLAKDILNKLKVSFGDMNIMSGLNILPEDAETIGSISGVLAMFDRLLAYARSIDPSILQHPAVMSAIQAFGQMGYLCKEEAMRLATSSKNTKMAERIAGQLSRTANQFAHLNDKRFGALTERINKGIDTVIEKTQAISGPSALVGHSIQQNISSFMTAAPTAGMANKITQQTTQKTVANQQGEENAARAQADRAVQQAAQAAARSNRDQQQVQQQRQNARAANARQARQQAQRSLRQSQQLQQQRAQADHSHDHHHHGQSTSAIQAPKQAQTAADIAKQIDPRILMGFQNATNTSNIKTGAVTPKNAKDTIAQNLYGNTGNLRPPPLMPGTTPKGSMAQPNQKTEAQQAADSEKKKQIDQQMLAPPPPPPNRGGRER